MIRPIALSGDLTVASRVRSSWLAYSALTTVVNGAEIAVVARGAIRFRRIRTNTGTRVARACVVTLIARSTRDRRPAASSVGTDIILRARIAVVTRAAVCLGGVRACPGRWITGAGIVALIARSTRHWIGA